MLLLILGLPIFVVLILTSAGAIYLLHMCRPKRCRLTCSAASTISRCSRCRFSCWPAKSWAAAALPIASSTWVVSIIGGVRGSLAVTTVASSELFGAMAHTTVGTVVAIGRLLFPSLTKHGYSERFAVSLITSSGAVAVIIPPSIAMILYAMTAQVSAIKLFTAGILPSLLIGVVDAIYVMIYAQGEDGAAVVTGALEKYLGLDQGRKLGDRHAWW